MSSEINIIQLSLYIRDDKDVTLLISSRIN